ncbi:hypothetical protein [Shewanella woodyi]|uniref:hypothetical protein n=1 Tax=Shewanella woodyi TaxID=60961 RepID=UPI00374A6024
MIIDDDKSVEFDFILLGEKPAKLEILRCRKLERLSINRLLEGLVVMNSPKLTELYVPTENNLKYVDLYKCNKLLDFSFLRRLDSVLYLSVGGNSNLKNLDFLNDSSNVVILNLSESKLIKDSSVVNKLKKLKKLKYLTTAATQKNWLY